MTASVHFLVWCLFLVSLCAHGVVIRIRLSDGSLRRIDIDGQEVTSHGELRSFLHKEGIINSSPLTKLKVKGKVLVDGDAAGNEKEDTFIWKAGEIVEIIEDVIEKKGYNSSIESSSASSSPIEIPGKATTASTKKRMPGRVTPMRGKGKGVLTSVADMKKRRENMTKIKAQKVPKNRIVNIVPSAARILDRLATNGGIAILCGQYLKAEDKKGKTKKVGKTATIDNTKSKNKHADTIIEIKTVFEVSTGYDSAENKILISQEMNDVNKAVKIAESLGFAVVGCCIGSKPLNEKTPSTNAPRRRGKIMSNDDSDDMSKKGNLMWTAHHVFTSLQLRSMLPPSHNNSLVVICAAKNSTGLALEAFQLSDQALNLFENGTLLSQQAPLQPGTKEKDVIKTNVQLASEVLIKSEETFSIDPTLLSIPLPIDSASTTDSSKEGEVVTGSGAKRKAGKAITVSELSEVENIEVASILDEYEHVFPTTAELHSDVTQSKLARKHIGRILKTGINKDIKGKMRDPHLLLYMGEQLDEKMLDLLCKYVGDRGAGRPPAKLSMSLDMLKMTFDDNSNGDDDSIDDEL